MPPTLGNGKICYIDIPAKDIAVSSNFYRDVFGWDVRTRGDGSVAFDDAVGEVSGTWSIGRPPATPGLMVHIMVKDAEATVAKIIEHGGEIVVPISADPPEITAHFKDPAGNVFGIYQDSHLRNE